MSDYKAPLDDIRFAIQEVFAFEQFWSTLEGVEDLDMDTANAILEEASKLSEEVIAPLNREADEKGCHWSDGQVTTPEGFKEAYQTYSDGGWGGLGGNPEFGGMGMPKTLCAAVEEMMQGGGIAFGLAPMLTSGAALALNIHGSEELKSLYLPKLYSGEWSGAMDLTEPHCGTDLGLIRSKAEPQGDGSYLLSGTKIFITWGEHDMNDNIVHFVLAKLPDAPEGSRGISLFLVPKILPDGDGNLGEQNAVSCGSIEKKMGIKASATCVMNFDGAKAWLVGQENKGLACMFTMMNYERLAVGIQGLAVAQWSYQSAVDYARDRLQGRSPTGAKSPEKAADSLLVHPDVRRMLMSMRAFNEGGRAFYLYLSSWLDLAKYSNDSEQKKRAEDMVALLTPVAKAFMTDIALLCAIDGQQVLGGHGYIREWGQEQHVRDIRITQIYEGTNGVQAMDLIGRKTIASGGLLLKSFVDEIKNFCDTLSRDEMQEFSLALQSATADLSSITDELVQQAQGDANVAGAVAVEYLHLFGYVSYAYMWAKMMDSAYRCGEPAAFCQAKIATGTFYFQKLLPQSASLILKIKAGASATMGLDDEAF